MVFDRVLVEVMKNRMQSIADEMASVVLHTGFTVFVKETGDFGCCLVTPQGEVFASPVKTGVTLAPGMDAKPMIDHIGLGDIQEGDVIIANDPYTTGGLSTHLADLFLLKPILYEGELLCFGLTFIHASDVGGKVPGSISPTSYDIYQEGLRIPPVKLYKKGTLDRELLQLVLSNCRIPEQNWGDLRALLSSLDVAERRIRELVDRYGRVTVVSAIADVMDYAEQQARDLIREIPDGSYENWDYLEGDVFGGPPIRIRCKMTVQGTDIHLDFTGTDPQVRAAFNLPSLGNPHHYMLISTFVRYFRTVRPDLPFNAGLVRPIHCHLPEGTLLNPAPPAACGVRAAAMIRTLDVTMATLGQALKDRIPAAGAGQGCIVLLAMPDIQAGKQTVGVIQPLIGGSGGRPTKDGIDGMDHQVGWLRNVPTETVETDMPILVTEYGLRPDSGGPGRFRGGCGILLGIKIFTPDTLMTARGMERTIFRPWGRDGGHPGSLGLAALSRHGEEERVLGKIDELVLQPGDTIVFNTPGGGGYGDPFDRDPQAVLEDVLDGLVSMHQAQEDYGVMIVDGEVEFEGTRAVRGKRRRSSNAFVFGPERDAYEGEWPDALQLAINEVVARHSVAVRSFMRERVMECVRRTQRRPDGWTADSLAQLLEAAQREFDFMVV